VKILIIGPYPQPINGCSYANHIFKSNLVKRKIKCDVINTSVKLQGNDHGKFALAKVTSFFHVYLRTVKILSFDIIYFTPGQTFLGVLKYSPFILLCIAARKKYIIHLHGNFLGEQYSKLKGFKKKVFHFLLSNASAGIVLSTSLLSNFDGILPRNKLYVVENFVSSDLYSYELHEKGQDKLRIIFLSNLMREKGILEFLDSLILLEKKEIDFEAIVAGGMENDLEEEINNRLELIGRKIKYLGTITGNAKKEKLINSNVFVLPTYYRMEGQPISLLEGMATGNIIITTNFAGIPDIVSDANGFFVEPKSAEEITNCLEKISSNLKEMINSYSSFNRNYSCKIFTEKNFTDKLLNIINAVSET
jgi:glycosyltransferase involved in cell wall biosynthesis